MHDELTSDALIEFGFAVNDCIARADELIREIKADLAGLDTRASLLLRAVSIQANAHALRDDVLRHLDALDRAA